MHPGLYWLASRVLRMQIGVASSCNDTAMKSMCPDSITCNAPCLTFTSGIFSAWKHIMGERRTRTGKTGHLDDVIMSIYTNKRVMKKFKAEHHSDYDSAIGSSSSPGPELDGDLEATSQGAQYTSNARCVHARRGNNSRLCSAMHAQGPLGMRVVYTRAIGLG